MIFLNLIRYKNLLFIVGLQWLMRYSVIHPLFRTFNLDDSYFMTDLQFILLVAASVLIAAGGYVVNDIFDTRTDEINRSENVIVGKSISKKTASTLHIALTGTGIILGLFISYLCSSMSLAFIMIMIPGLLWFYSASYKRQFLIGNIIVAFCAALIPTVISLAEISFLSLPQHYNTIVFETIVPKTVYTWTLGFSAFAFLGTLIREIIKDMEDIEGDQEVESRTMPNVWGLNKSKIVVYALIAITIAAALYIQFNNIDKNLLLRTMEESTLSLRYMIFGIIIPFIYLSYLLIKAKDKASLNQASTFMKFILVLGSLYALIFYFLLCKAQGIAMFDLFIVK
jgi:4-hydroxybenzoate polyprenyltransferase